MDTKTYKIGEVARELGVKAFVLRFWESEFPQVVPLRTPSGQRVYTEEHIKLLKRIQILLREEGLTIEGARKKLQEEEQTRKTLKYICEELRVIKKILSKDK